MSYTGGFRVESGSLRLSARGATNPLILAFLSLAAAWVLAPAGARRATLATDLAALGIRVPPWVRTSRAATLVAALAAVAVTAAGLIENSRTAGASDAYGYVSQARMFAGGRLEIDEPLLARLPAYDRRAFAPLGWVPDAARAVIVPTYPQGLPLLMSVFARAGGPDALFAVVPLLAGLAVWATFVFGRALAGPAVGAAGALLLASSPVFLYQTTTWPMSDVPATAWWTLCMALLAGGGWRRALGAGLAAGAAILTRPNLVPVVRAPLVLLLWPLVGQRQSNRTSIASLAAFAPGVAAGSLAVAAFNWHWFGSPISSGYGSLDPLYGWRFIGPNIRNFTIWLAETQTPLFVMAGAGPFLIRHLAARSAAWAGLTAGGVTLVVIVLVSYLFYFPFPPWWNLRFLMPAFPVLLVFLATAILGVARRWRGEDGAMAAAALIVALSAHGVSTARERSAFETSAEVTYAEVGAYVKDRLPDTAVVLSVLHSGSVRLYANRPTIRWDWVMPAELDILVDRLVALGLTPYVILDAGEVEPFRSRFASASAIAGLDGPPIAEIPGFTGRIIPLTSRGPTP